MRNEIVEKLRNVLSSGIETEAQVVYLLVEIRKLIDQSKVRDRYLSVLFFCEWALHVKMSRQSAFLFLKEIDEAFENAVTTEQLGKLIGTRLSMDTFRDDLIHVLIDHELPTDAIRTKHGWLAFLPLYLSVITDCPVLTQNVYLKHINKLTVRIDWGPPKEIPRNVHFGFASIGSFGRMGTLPGDGAMRFFIQKMTSSASLISCTSLGRLTRAQWSLQIRANR